MEVPPDPVDGHPHGPGDHVQQSPNGFREALEMAIRTHPFLTLILIAVFAYIINKLHYKMDEWRHPAPTRHNNIESTWDEKRRLARLRQQQEYEEAAAAESIILAARKKEEDERRAACAAVGTPGTGRTTHGGLQGVTGEATPATPSGPKQPKDHGRSEYNPLTGHGGSSGFRPSGFSKKKGG